MKILTSAEMREVDRIAIEEVGIPGPVLMENAGRGIVDVLLTRFPRVERERVVVVAGRGNNGGDGLVVARHLRNRGGNPVVLLLAAKEEVKGDAALNLAVAEKSGVDVRDASTDLCWKKVRPALAEATVIIDAIFGTGLTKPAEGLFAEAIGDINKASGFKIAVDIPSGLSSDTFKVIGPAVKADLTVTLAAPKVVHIFPPAQESVGDLVCADIGMPPSLFENESLRLEMVEKKDVSPFFRKRKRDAHKGSYGHVFILSGSLGKTGAAVMVAKAAYRTGAGLVTVGTPAGCVPIIAKSMVELMTEPLTETKEKTLSAEALPRIMGLLEGKYAAVIGPGISTHPSTADLVRSLIPRLKIPAVIDADGLNDLAEDPSLLKKASAPLVLTPHPGEFARLTGRTTQEVLDGRLELVPRFAREHALYLVLKGYRTLIAAPDGRVFVNPTGNPGMATGGSGDVLSGMIASFIGQEPDFLGAILAAVYLHGLSGDLAAARLSERALIAGDIIRFLPPAIKSLESGQS
ncbi:MAG: NAD(P)H-hydrate dehydratase [Candidatus Aminicenantes bacterium]|nr:NAD(P)H-hydrate dehydratase [Candidatus Aminicenantes bacterium]